MSRNVYSDNGLEMELHRHITADLLGNRNPQDEPDYLADVIGFLVAQLNNDQADELASRLGFQKVDG